MGVAYVYSFGTLYTPVWYVAGDVVLWRPKRRYRRCVHPGGRGLNGLWAFEGKIMKARTYGSHSYIIRFKLPFLVEGGHQFMESRLPWTEENRSQIENEAQAELDYMFDNWSDMTVEPVPCSA